MGTAFGVILVVLSTVLLVLLVIAWNGQKALKLKVTNLEHDKIQIKVSFDNAISSLKPIRDTTDKPPEWTRDRALLALRSLESTLPEFGEKPTA